MHDHAGERAEVDAPRCGVRLANAGDHDAAYVDVSNEKATIWGQAGWWLGTSGSGRFFGSPVGYIEYRLSDGTYLWQSLGPPPAGARYRVANSGLVLHDAKGRTFALYRITASFVSGPLATYPYPAASGDNAGLAESYSSGGVVEPIGPAAYRDIALFDRGRWRTWTRAVDGARRSVASGDRLRLDARWHAWEVSGRLRFGPPLTRPVLRPVARPPAAEPAAARAGWRLFAPPALVQPGRAVQIGAIAADRAGRLVGTGLRADGGLVLWRFRPGAGVAAAPAVWALGDLRRGVGSGAGARWVALAHGASAYVGDDRILWLPPGRGPVRTTALGPGGPVLAAAAGPAGRLALVRGAGPSLELWRPAAPGDRTPGRFRLARRLNLPAGSGHPDAIAYLGRGRWLADRPDAGPEAYAGLTALSLSGSGRLAAVARPAPALHLAAGGGAVAAAGGDRGRGVRVRIGPRAAWREPRPLGATAAWGDSLAVGADGRVWATARGPDTRVVGWLRGKETARVVLPPLWVREDPPRARSGAQGPAIVAAPAYAVRLAAGPGWVAAAPEGQALVFVALAPPTPGRSPVRPAGRSRRGRSP